MNTPKTTAYIRSSSYRSSTGTRQVAVPAMTAATLCTSMQSTRGQSTRRPVRIRDAVLLMPSTDRMRLARHSSTFSCLIAFSVTYTYGVYRPEPLTQILIGRRNERHDAVAMKLSSTVWTDTSPTNVDDTVCNKPLRPQMTAKYC